MQIAEKVLNPDKRGTTWLNGNSLMVAYLTKVDAIDTGRFYSFTASSVCIYYGTWQHVLCFKYYFANDECAIL